MMIRMCQDLLPPPLLLLLLVQSTPGQIFDDETAAEDDSNWPHYLNDDDETRDYRGHALLRIIPQDQYHLKLLASLVNESDVNGIDFWKEPTAVKRNVDILVAPQNKDYLAALMRDNGLEFDVVTDDIQSLVDEERRTRNAIERALTNIAEVSNPKPFNLSTYHTYDEIMSYLDRLNNTCNSTCETEVIGKSYEGRDLTIIKIGDIDDKSKAAFWIDAGIHAREWISPAAALYLISKLLDDRDEIGRYLVKRFRWYVLPLANPDGYEFTWTSDRLWRKNRSKHPDQRVKCKGTDLNRNFDYHWGGRGTSDKACAENYSGWLPFSELESRAIANYILSISDSLAIYVSLHSYGQYILTPWGYTTKLPKDYNELMALGSMAADEIRQAHGKHYTVGSASRVLYLASGGSDDWVKAVAGVKYAFTIELRDEGRNGFILPVSMITDTSDELLHAVKGLAGGSLKLNRRRLRKN